MTALKRLTVLALSTAALGLGGCVNLLPESTPNAVYRLSSPPPIARRGGDWTLVRVDMPQAPRGLGGDDVAMLIDGQHLAYMSGAQWIASTPRIVQDLVFDSLHATDGHLSPARPEDGVRSDYELRLDIREFEAAYEQGMDAAPTVRVRFAARMVSQETREFVASEVFVAQVRASENRMRSIIDAFDAAAGQAARDLSVWAVEVTDSAEN